MKPAQLTAANFATYPPQGQKIAIENLATLRRVPLSLVPTFLRDLQGYDWKFPAEQREIEARLAFLQSPKAPLDAFAEIRIPDELERSRWIEEPDRFVEELTAYLWSSHQIDAYHLAAKKFLQAFAAEELVTSPSLPRLVVVMIGRGAQSSAYPLFQRLAPRGQILTNVDVSSAPSAISDALATRAKGLPEPHAHWYVDGGSRMVGVDVSNVTQLIYPDVAPVKQQILRRMDEAIRAGAGPEALRSSLARLSPSELSVDGVTADPRVQRLIVSLFTEGSGTQIFSTSFVQWSSREILRRAQPVTMCARYGPRIRQQSFNAMVLAASSTGDGVNEVDAEGSLIDADMGAYYTYLELMKLPQAENATFLVYVEGKAQAFWAGPGVPRGTHSDAQIKLGQILEQAV